MQTARIQNIRGDTISPRNEVEYVTTVRVDARGLQVDRPRVHAWIGAWNDYGDQGLWEGHRTGRPAQLSARQWEQLADILDSGPVAYGLNTGVWTSP